MSRDDNVGGKAKAAESSGKTRIEEHYSWEEELSKKHGKRFDTTTPTLIDEDDDDEDMVELQRSFDQLGMRRTPGAATAAAATEEMRRTPGATSKPTVAAPGTALGFGLMLSTPLGDKKEEKQQKSSSAWNDETETKAKSQPFSFAPWRRSERSSSGAFSPGILKQLTEDCIGNLLQDDDDDDNYTMPMPNFSCGTKDTTKPVTDYDWTGSFDVDDPNKSAVPSRLFPGAENSKSGNNNKVGKLQPKPRRQIFDFGVQAPKPQQEVNESSQPVSGGAFVPLESELRLSQQARSVAPFFANSESNRPRVASMPGYQIEQDPYLGAPMPPGDGLREQSQSFDSYQVGRQVGRYPSAPSLGQEPYPPLGAGFGVPQSEMQATARVFVPHVGRSPTPQFQGQQQWPGQYDQSMDPSWRQQQPYSYPSNAAYMQPPPQPMFDPRAMTPSPHLHQQPQWPIQGDVASTMPSLDSTTYSMPTESTQSRKSSKRTKKKRQPKAEKGEIKKTVSRKNRGGLSSEDVHASASEDQGKRGEVIESPATRIAFKEFYRSFRNEERLSFQKAEKFAIRSLEDGSLPESVHWRVYLELADLAKRSNRYAEARRIYQKVCELQPYASQGWLEFSKLEEECGNFNRVMNILHAGLIHCEYNESLFTRAVKHQEKMGNLADARGLLARLKHVGIEKVWRTVLEGALLEARAGNVDTARRLLKYLMHHVPWYGPLYLEAYRLEKDQGHPLDALEIVEKGLQAIPRYGPLWFGAFRLCEEMDMGKNLYHLPSSINMIERAASSISKELVWKVHLEAAQMLERSAVEQAKAETHTSVDALLYPARRRLAITVLSCPNNLRWKVWLSAARMELGFGNLERSRGLFLRAHDIVPKKGRSSTLLECSRLENFVGKEDLARAILQRARVEFGQDWKVWLESVLLEIRCRNFLTAMSICDKALKIHQGTGRLWATLVQLRYYDGRDEAQIVALRRALNAVPKSGEVWCEGGRIHLNPFSCTFNIERAERHLYFATRFTPQYGDGFVETIRMELLKQWLQPLSKFIWETTKSPLTSQGSDDEKCTALLNYLGDVFTTILLSSRKPSVTDSKDAQVVPEHQRIVEPIRQWLSSDNQRSKINLDEVRRACVNADPNYGLLWFRCRKKCTDAPRRIIEDAATVIATELREHAHHYIAAMVRREAVLFMAGIDLPERADNDKDEEAGEDRRFEEWEEQVDTKLHVAPSLDDCYDSRDPGRTLFTRPTGGNIFATGLTELNQHEPIEQMTLADRRRVLFGNDSLFP